MDATNDTRGVDGDWILDATSWTPGMYIVHVTQLGTTRQLPWIKVRRGPYHVRTWQSYCRSKSSTTSSSPSTCAWHANT